MKFDLVMYDPRLDQIVRVRDFVDWIEVQESETDAYAAKSLWYLVEWDFQLLGEL